MSLLRSHEPKGTEFCLCGSGLAFRICCHGKYGSRSYSAIERLLAEKRTEKAIEECRKYLTWYRLCHLAHTAPCVRANVPGIGRLLSVDIDALSAIVQLLTRCLVETGVPDAVAELLRSVTDAVDHQKWRDKVFAMWVWYYWHIKDDPVATWNFLTSTPQFSTTTEEAAFMAWISVAPSNVTTEQKLTVVARLRRNTSDPEIRLHCDLITSALKAAAGSEDEAQHTLQAAVAEFRGRAASQATVFGRFKFSQALECLGQMTGDSQLIEESITEAQKYLAASADLAQDSSRDVILCQCGEACLYLGQPDRAIAFLESALAENGERMVPMIFLCKSYTAKSDFDTARSWREKSKVFATSPENRLDLAFAATELAVESKDVEDVECALRLIGQVEKAEGIFEKHRQQCVDQLLAIQAKTKSIGAPRRFWFSFLTRWAILQPNVIGFGLNINNVIEDATKKHIARG